MKGGGIGMKGVREGWRKGLLEHSRPGDVTKTGFGTLQGILSPGLSSRLVCTHEGGT